MNIWLHCLWGSKQRDLSGTWGVKKKIKSFYQHDSMPEANLLSTALSAHTLPVAQCPTPPCWRPLKPLEQGFTVCWLQTAPSSWKNWKPAWVPCPILSSKCQTRLAECQAGSANGELRRDTNRQLHGAGIEWWLMWHGDSSNLGLGAIPWVSRDAWEYTGILETNWNVLHFRSKYMPCSIGRVGEAKIEYKEL